jgi:hypothetical protein
MYIVRSEEQAFVDAGALAAAAQLDGTNAGVTRAKAQAAAAWNKYHFESTNFSTPTIEFALAAATGSTPPYQAGTWTTAPTCNAALPNPPCFGWQFTRVTSSVSLPMFLMPIIPGTSANATIAAKAIAGQMSVYSISEGLLPFTALAHSTDPATYGFVPGQNYSIKWTNSNKLSDYCQGDQIDNPGSPIANYTTANSAYSSLSNGSVYKGHQFMYDAENAGFGSKGTEAGCGSGGCNWTSFIVQSASNISAAVQAGYQGAPVSVGTDMVPWLNAGGGGSINTIGKDLNTRVNNDSNQTSYYTACTTISGCDANVTNWQTGYTGTGNGQRVVAVAVVGPPTWGNSADQIATVLTFGLFLLDTSAAYKTTGNSAWCAMYLGSSVEWTNKAGAGGPGLYALRLVQ